VEVSTCRGGCLARARVPYRLTDDLTAHVLANRLGSDDLDFLFEAHGADAPNAKRHFLDRAERCANRAWRDVVLDFTGLRSDPRLAVDDADADGAAAAADGAAPASPPRRRVSDPAASPQTDAVTARLASLALKAPPLRSAEL